LQNVSIKESSDFAYGTEKNHSTGFNFYLTHLIILACTY